MAPQHSRQAVKEALDDVASPGSTCVGGDAPEMPALPGLEVAGVGPIALPLIEAQARALAGVAEQAPHGRGAETLVDTSVRNALQIDAWKVTLRNPAWGPALLQRVQAAADALGVHKGAVRAELYKLLLYEPGGFFRAHRDTEKAQGMFGTLVIQLPSLHTGGAVEVRHAGQRSTFTMGSGGAAAYGCQYVAFYSDCQHEIKPVESGHRLALIYCLCYTGTGEPPSAQALGDLSKLEAALEGLPGEDSLLVLPLSHQYTTTSLGHLGVGCLKGADRARFTALRTASKGAFVFRIALADRTDEERGDSGGECFEESEPGEPEISDIYNADGSTANDAVAKLPIDWFSCDDGGAVLGSEGEVEEMWAKGNEGDIQLTGNEGATREVEYSTCVLLAHRAAAELELLLKEDVSAVVQKQAKHAALGKMSRIVAYLERQGPRGLLEPDFLRLFAAFSKLYAGGGEPSKEKVVDMLRAVIGMLATEVPLSDTLVHAIVEAVHTCGWAALSEAVLEFIGALRACKKTLPERAELVVHLQTLGASADLLATLAEDVLTALEAPQKTVPSWGAYEPCGEERNRARVLTRRSAEVLFQVGDLKRFVRWAEGASEPELKTAVHVLPADATGAAADARGRIVELQRKATLEVLRARCVELEAATVGGEPAFTWAMPGVRGMDEPLLAFLRSSHPGPQSIWVGGGVKNARRIVSDLVSEYGRYRRQRLESFSVTAEEAGKGAGATVTVTKTKAYHERLVTQYRKAVADLRQARAQINKLSGGGGEAIASEGDADTPGFHVRKKPRTALPRKKASTLPPFITISD